jgi:Ca2+-binding RTX toxin-like protein
LTIDGEGNLYGYAINGANDKTIWELAKGSNSLTTLYTFAQTPGTYPAQEISTLTADSAGDIFGLGTDATNMHFIIWELAKGSSTITNRYTFALSLANPSGVAGITVDSYGNLYGAYTDKDSNGYVWELEQGSNTLTTLAETNSSYSEIGYADSNELAIDGNGDVYGTGGDTADEGVWELAKGASTFTPIGGLGANGIAIDRAGDLFFTAGYGSTYEEESLDEIPANSPSFVSFADGVLTINGTSGNDQITLESEYYGDGPIEAIVNGATSNLYEASSITAININGGDGNDLITIDSGVPTTPGVSVQGGPGDDTIQGGPGNDTLGGGQGNDFILGGPGDDLIHGGAGDDSLGGGQGNDILYGGPGNDTMTGGAGNDVLIGGAGNNVLHGGLGDDTLFAINGAADTLYGGAGNDTAHIDQGLDQIPNNDIETVLFV